jgi:ATP phosphoribosyltransferase
MGKLRILIPKGRIYDNVSKLFSEAGIAISLSDRTYRPNIGVDWLDGKVMKPQKRR